MKVKVLLSLCLLSSSLKAEYLSLIEDLPLMEGLQEVEDRQLKFDSPQGRLIEAEVKTAHSIDKTRKYYRETLPQLGWKILKKDQYVRESELLTLDFGQEGKVVFRLAPYIEPQD